MRPESKLVRSGLSDQVYQELQRQLLDLERHAGERLVIDQIARDLGVSATPVRDALNRLAAERVIDFEAYIGFTVRPEPSPEELERSFEARLCIEAFAARLGATRARPGEVARLRALQDALVADRYTGSSASFLTFVTRNREFHEVIVGTSRNPFLVEAARGLHHDVLVARVMHDRGVPDIEQIRDEHEAIIVGFERRDPDAAAAAVVRHIEDGCARIVAARLAHP